MRKILFLLMITCFSTASSQQNIVGQQTQKEPTAVAIGIKEKCIMTMEKSLILSMKKLDTHVL